MFANVVAQALLAAIVPLVKADNSAGTNDSIGDLYDVVSMLDFAMAATTAQGGLGFGFVVEFHISRSGAVLKKLELTCDEETMGGTHPRERGRLSLLQVSSKANKSNRLADICFRVRIPG